MGGLLTPWVLPVVFQSLLTTCRAAAGLFSDPGPAQGQSQLITNTHERNTIRHSIQNKYGRATPKKVCQTNLSDPTL